MKDVILKEHVFNHPIDKVWRAITNQDEISTWFIKADFKAEKGYRYTFKAGEESGCTEINGEIVEVNPYTLIYTWVVQDTDVVTTVKWDLEKLGEKTKLVLEHSGISKYQGETAVNMFASFDKGWDNCAMELAKFLKQVHAQ